MAEEQTDSITEQAPEPQPGLIAFIRVVIRVAVSAGLGAALWVIDLKVYGDTGPLPDIVASPIFGAWCGVAGGLIWGPIIELAVPRATERQRWIALAGSMVTMCLGTAAVWASPPVGVWWGLRMLVMLSVGAIVVESVSLVLCTRGQEPAAEQRPAERPEGTA